MGAVGHSHRGVLLGHDAHRALDRSLYDAGHGSPVPRRRRGPVPSHRRGSATSSGRRRAAMGPIGRRSEAVGLPPVKLSVVIPCFNEELTLKQCVERVLALRDDDLELEVVIVDDCSRDRSADIARDLAAGHREVRLLRHPRNQGKGAALRTGFREVTGDFVAVQDADLEYDPRELRALIEPLRDGRADVVIGSRFKGAGPHRVLYFWQPLGNALLTLLSNVFTDLNLSDMESGYKVFRREIIQSIDIEEDRFGFEPEIVAKVAHMRVRVYEMAISYSGRTYEEGKKITWKDGLRALYCIVRYNAFRLPSRMGLRSDIRFPSSRLLARPGASRPPQSRQDHRKPRR